MLRSHCPIRGNPTHSQHRAYAAAGELCAIYGAYRPSTQGLHIITNVAAVREVCTIFSASKTSVAARKQRVIRIMHISVALKKRGPFERVTHNACVVFVVVT